VTGAVSAGRRAVAPVLAAKPTAAPALCGTFDQVKDYLNVHKDALQADDRILPQVPCDALSFGQAFKARQATADARDIEVEPAPTECPQPRHPQAPRQGCFCSPTGGGCRGDGG
jgi:hypothetical protein